MEPSRGSTSLTIDIEKQLALMLDRAPSCRRVLEVVRDLMLSEAGDALNAQFERAWQHRTFRAYYERPLLLLAALRNDVLVEDERHPLFRALGPGTPEPDTVTPAAVTESLSPSRLAVWMSLRGRRVQTNEPKRAVTWLWPAALAGANRRGRSVALVDVGASAGLNLVSDSVAIQWQASDGLPLRCARDVDAVVRMGFDTRPLDVRKADDRRWLEACVWPGERERLDLQRRAVAAFLATTPRPEISTATASAVPARLMQLGREVSADCLVIAFQTMVMGYLQEAEREAYESGMEAWLAAAPPERAMWLTLEIGGTTDPERGTLIEARVARGGHATRIELAKTGYHPELLHVDRDAERELEFLVAPS